MKLLLNNKLITAHSHPALPSRRHERWFTFMLNDRLHTATIAKDNFVFKYGGRRYSVKSADVFPVNSTVTKIRLETPIA